MSTQPSLDPWSMPNWVVYKYFPASRQRDFIDFLLIEKLILLMKGVGFTNIQVNRQHSLDKVKLSEFLEYASQRHRTSQLIAISDEEYENGIVKLKEYVARLGSHYFLTSEMCLVWVTGDKPE